MPFAAAQAADIRNNVLEYAQRANNGAIYASKKQCQDKQPDDNSRIQRQNGRYELYVGQPAEPNMQCSRKIKEQ